MRRSDIGDMLGLNDRRRSAARSQSCVRCASLTSSTERKFTSSIASASRNSPASKFDYGSRISVFYYRLLPRPEALLNDKLKRIFCAPLDHCFSIRNTRRDKIRMSITRAEAADRLEQIALQLRNGSVSLGGPKVDVAKRRLNSKAKRKSDKLELEIKWRRAEAPERRDTMPTSTTRAWQGRT